MARQNTTEPIVLGLLAHEDSSGYDLKKKIDLMVSFFWNVGYGQLYPALKKLESDGCIQGRPEPSAKGPDRTVYSITDRGRQSLNAWLDLPPEREAVRYEILLKLFFGSRMGAERNAEMVEDFRRRQAENLNLMRLYRKNLQRVMAENADHLYYDLTVLFGEKIYQAYLDWAAEAERLLQNAAAAQGKENSI